ncbi:MAG: phytoene/squalene synthase family protein [Bacteroidales bacterium]|nr:MAG: phytoene/squalene synthase family protein [Bacteroidales bacterium]
MEIDRIALYNDVSLLCSATTTQKYSTSFSLGTKLFSRDIQEAIYSIYGFVRVADEIVDSFHSYNKEKLLADFKKQTYEAISEKISTNPILQSYQIAVNRYNIDRDLIDAFLKSMEMDLNPKLYSRDEIGEYIYGSAEVVGLMCLKVFCRGNQEEFDKLCLPAKKLGAAFQKINFLRDIRDDYNDLGRVYFPGVDFNNFTQKQKAEIEQDIQADFDDAYVGIKQLNRDSQLGVYVAYKYYTSLFKKIKKVSPNELLSKRYRISNFKKIALLARCWVVYKLKMV